MKAKKRYEKARAKYDRKIERLQPRIRTLLTERARLKGERIAKG